MEEKYGGCSSAVERLPVEEDVGGPIPLSHPNFIKQNFNPNLILSVILSAIGI